MKVIVVCESPVDEAALRVFIQSQLPPPVQFQSAPIRLGGYTSVVKNLPALIKAAYYQTDADGIVVVVDSDNSPIVTGDAGNRLESLRGIAASVWANLRSRPQKISLRTAFGLAVPSVEAWLLFGNNPACTEAGWRIQQGNRRMSRDVIISLKRELYGSERRPQSEQAATAAAAAQQLVDAGSIDDLRNGFPFGFGSFVTDLQQW